MKITQASLLYSGWHVCCFLQDYLYAANCVISSSELKGVPRTEATSVVGALLPFPAILPDIPLLLPNSNELSLISSADVKDQVKIQPMHASFAEFLYLLCVRHTRSLASCSRVARRNLRVWPAASLCPASASSYIPSWWPAASIQK